MTTLKVSVALSSHSEGRRHETHAFNKTLYIYSTLLKVRVLFFLCIIYLLFQRAVGTNVTWHYLEAERNLKCSPWQLFLSCLLRFYTPYILPLKDTHTHSTIHLHQFSGQG